MHSIVAFKDECVQEQQILVSAFVNFLYCSFVSVRGAKIKIYNQIIILLITEH